MHEARAVLARIRRIDALQREWAGPDALLAEVERLVEEAGEWISAEGGDARATSTLERVRGAVEDTRKAMIPM
jgi:hypothetical protein